MRENTRSTNPRKMPTATATEITIMVSLIVSCRVGHVTLLSSPTTSPNIRRLTARRAACVPSLRVNPGSRATLPHLSVQRVRSTSRAKFLEFQPLGVVAAILGRVIRSFPAINATKGYENSCFCSPGHRIAPWGRNLLDRADLAASLDRSLQANALTPSSSEHGGISITLCALLGAIG